MDWVYWWILNKKRFANGGFIQVPEQSAKVQPVLMLDGVIDM